MTADTTRGAAKAIMTPPATMARVGHARRIFRREPALEALRLFRAASRTSRLGIGFSRVAKPNLAPGVGSDG